MGPSGLAVKSNNSKTTRNYSYNINNYQTRWSKYYITVPHNPPPPSGVLQSLHDCDYPWGDGFIYLQSPQISVLCLNPYIKEFFC